jgi:hypothetical protein
VHIQNPPQKSVKKALKTAAFLLKSGAFLLRTGAFLLKNTKKYAFFCPQDALRYYLSYLIVTNQPPNPHFSPKNKDSLLKLPEISPHFPIFLIFHFFMHGFLCSPVPYGN